MPVQMRLWSCFSPVFSVTGFLVPGEEHVASHTTGDGDEILHSI